MSSADDTLLSSHCAALLWQSPVHRACLEAVATLELPDCWTGAGFVRNLIWDFTHQFSSPTPLNDVDVIFFDKSDTSKTQEQHIQRQLRRLYPAVNWEVRNQARMHLKHDFPPFADTLDAISHWVEKETAVAARYTGTETEIIAPYGLKMNYSNSITPHPAFPAALFESRVSKKCWQQIWPALWINHDS